MHLETQILIYSVYSKRIKEPEKHARLERNKEQIPPGRATAAAYIRIRLALAVQYLDSSIALIQPGLQLD